MGNVHPNERTRQTMNHAQFSNEWENGRPHHHTTPYHTTRPGLRQMASRCVLFMFDAENRWNFFLCLSFLHTFVYTFTIRIGIGNLRCRKSGFREKLPNVGEIKKKKKKKANGMEREERGKLLSQEMGTVLHIDWLKGFGFDACSVVECGMG